MIYRNAAVFCDGQFLKQDIEVEEGFIKRVGDVLPGVDGEDLRGYRMIPGIVDVHTHGCLGYDFSTVSIEAIEKMEVYYRSKGVTSILATVMTGAPEELLEAVRTIKTYKQNNPDTIIKGIHLEGPFFGESKKGAHDKKYLKQIDVEWFEALDEAAGNLIKLVSIDPTLEGAEDFIKKYSSSKTIALGHTNATYKQGVQAVKAGAKQITHLFNAMEGMHHREPGLIGVMSDCDIYAELITDGIHVHPSVVKLCFKLNPEKIIIISDSISVAGLSEGETCVSGGIEVTIRDGRAVLKDGTIAGSTYTGFEVMRQAIQFGVNEEEAILSATTRPTHLLDNREKVGRIKVGYKADLLVVDESYNLKGVIQAGNRY